MTRLDNSSRAENTWLEKKESSQQRQRNRIGTEWLVQEKKSTKTEAASVKFAKRKQARSEKKSPLAGKGARRVKSNSGAPKKQRAEKARGRKSADAERGVGNAAWPERREHDGKKFVV